MVRSWSFQILRVNMVVITVNATNQPLSCWIKMPCPFLIFSQSDYLIQTVDINSHTKWQTVQIQISWLLQKPTDLDLHCLLRQGMSCSAREGLSCYFGNWSNCWAAHIYSNAGVDCNMALLLIVSRGNDITPKFVKHLCRLCILDNKTTIWGYNKWKWCKICGSTLLAKAFLSQNFAPMVGKLFLLRVNPILEKAWCAEEQTGSHKSCPP